MEEEINWQIEAEAVIQDVKAHVKNIHVSTVAPPSRGIYLNITIIEGQHFCVLLGPSGFLIVGNDHDNISLKNTNNLCYETPYAFLSAVSPSYKQSFGNLLIKKLNELQDQS